MLAPDPGYVGTWQEALGGRRRVASDVDRVWVPAVLALVTRSCVRSLPEHTRSVAGWSACALLWWHPGTVSQHGSCAAFSVRAGSCSGPGVALGGGPAVGRGAGRAAGHAAGRMLGPGLCSWASRPCQRPHGGEVRPRPFPLSCQPDSERGVALGL